MKAKNLAVKMQLAMNILFLVVMVPLSLSIMISLRHSLQEIGKNEMLNSAQLIRSKTELYVSSAVKNYLRARAESTRNAVQFNYNLYKSGKISEQEAWDRSAAMILDPTYGKIGATGYLAGVDTDGILVIHPLSQGVDASGLDFMKQAIAMKNGYIEYMWANSGETTERAKAGYISYFEPWDLMIFASSYKDEFKYLLDLDELRNSLAGLQVCQTGYPAIFTGDGTVVYHPDFAVGDTLPPVTGEGQDSLSALILRSKNTAGSDISDFYSGEINGEQRLGTVVYEPDMDWYIVTTVARDELFSPWHRVRNILLFGFVFAAVGMNILIMLIFRQMLSPLAEVRKVVSLFSKGDISRSINVSTEDEIGEIAREVNVLTNMTSEIIIKMRSDVMTITHAIQDLSSSSAEISTTSNEQASAVKEIVSTMEDSDSLSKGIEKRVSEVAQISEHAREIVSHGVDYVSKSLVKMEEIRVSNNDTIAGIRALSEKIEAIWEIVNIINSIADQTKIIAFNAELEASAAGEAGKNFQIVASEIRRLANSTVSSTSEIKSKINEIQHSSDRLITASEDGTNKIEEGGSLTETLHTTFEEILETSEISADSARDISESIKQQVYAFEQILLTLKQISEGINNFVISTKSTSETTENLKKMSDTMEQFLRRFKTAEQREDDGEEL